MHAAFAFSRAHPQLTSHWIENSNYICVLAIDNEIELVKLLQQAQQLDIPTAYFTEEDLDNSLTAVALAPLSQSKQLCSSLKLALKEQSK